MLFIVCNQGRPTTVFCKISVRRSKYCLEFSFAWARLKISSWNFHLCTTFEVYLRNSLGLSEVIFFIFYYPGYTFFLEKGNLKFSDSQMWWREESEKFSLSQNFELHLKFLQKPLYFGKELSSFWDDRTYKTVVGCHNHNIISGKAKALALSQVCSVNFILHLSSQWS